LKVWAEKFGVSETTLSYLGFGVLVPVALICALIPIVALMLIRRKGKTESGNLKLLVHKNGRKLLYIK
jgi:hypothetical protein